MTPIRFIEDTGSYAHRTKANAQWADITVAIAVDLNTSGEQLTRDSAGDRYLGLTIPKSLRIGEDRLVKTAIAHGIKAAYKMNLKCSILAPKDFRMTPAQGEDIFDKELFIARFQ